MTAKELRERLAEIGDEVPVVVKASPYADVLVGVGDGGLDRGGVAWPGLCDICGRGSELHRDGVLGAMGGGAKQRERRMLRAAQRVINGDKPARKSFGVSKAEAGTGRVSSRGNKGRGRNGR